DAEDGQRGDSPGRCVGRRDHSAAASIVADGWFVETSRRAQAGLRVEAKPSHNAIEPNAKLPRIMKVAPYPISCAIQPPINGLSDAPTPWTVITAPCPTLIRPLPWRIRATSAGTTTLCNPAPTPSRI